MACPKCVINPRSHNFIHFGNLEDKKLYYTAPAKALELIRSEADFNNIKMHLDEVTTPWIYIFDCSHMTLKHYMNISLVKKLALYLQTQQLDILKEIWVIFPNIWIKGVLKILKAILRSDLVKRIRIYDGSSLEIFMKMEKAGLTGESFTTLHNIINQPSTQS